ncbi:cysteine--tRNA ligase [Pectinatus cerevisiiphilus]|uniref:Cysteine--tRNA ligase n=1 Tax=Pectinatus cerevisiiphilus TaxID=86956 RepID=A0A4R3K4A3_9FIRM|nr:cysteine--tRNA ligase [Pectinatus cerevisiiphilus]TCS77497.1 cysteinyl-tRNA synthetase [Pectinatus cerevisiiphilus]
MLKVYNTLTRRKEEFKPVIPGQVSIYVCGITPYNDSHIGNARPFVTWDVIKRYFRKLGYKVKHVQNFTDVDDKIIRAANANHMTWKEISDKYIAGYFTVMDKLNIEHADVYPRVSENMSDIVKMIEGLVNKGVAYPLDGDVYFSVEKFAGYGKLSGRKLDDMQAGARVEVDSRKHHPMDFALWKTAKPGEPSWDSPWGKGRPGWHIECSTMSLKYLGKTFDFHGGGSDLIFPHHENEIAQSQSYCCDDHSFARYWLHNGFITINQEKMSKSLNNFFTVKDILKKYPAEVLRYFLVATHYRSPLDFSDERLKEAEAGLSRLSNAKDSILELLSTDAADSSSAASLVQFAEKAKQNFYSAMEDDFNTALALAAMFDLAKKINVYYQSVTAGTITADKENLRKVLSIYTDMTDILGILQTKTDNTGDSHLVDALMNILISIRQDARKNKDWATADKLRDELKKIGITIEDSPTGARWKN